MNRKYRFDPINKLKKANKAFIHHLDLECDNCFKGAANRNFKAYVKDIVFNFCSFKCLNSFNSNIMKERK